MKSKNPKAMKTGKFLLSICIVLIAVQCNKNEETANTAHQVFAIDTNLYPLMFKTGSYWVYQNQADSALDSLRITDANLVAAVQTPTNSTVGTSSEKHYYIMSYTSTKFPDYNEQVFDNMISRNYENNGIVYIEGQPGDYYYNTEVKALHDTLTVAGTLYRDVVEMDVWADQVIDYDMFLFYADSVGVIRRDYIINGTIVQTWDLIEYNVDLIDVE